mmetsp:Transcript_61302/g.142618  ORF Transcript_61302/g.142618 Transcript_61302/m.142618 type:complete len:484 (-) Transcript_61302:154-1605(-)
MTVGEPVGGNKGCAWGCQQAQKLRFLAITWLLVMLKGVIHPSIPYITNTFFAEAHGGGNCERDPDSDPCKQGAADAAFWHSISDASSHVVAMVVALALGSCSDKLGRLPVLRAGAVVSACVYLALALHVELGWTLWLYLVASPLAEAFDTNGVVIALLLDIQHFIPDEEERTAAWKILGTASIPIVACTMVLSFLVPQSWAMVVCLVATALQVLYMFVGFPETAMVAGGEKSAQDAPSLSDTMHDCWRVFTRNSFIPRLALVLAMLGFAGGAWGVIFPPFMTGRLGVQKRDKLMIGLAVFPTLIFWFGGRDTLEKRLGEINVLRFSLIAMTLLPVALLWCYTLWQLLLVMGVLVGPCLLAIPTMVRVKSLLVAPEEQGLIQGATAGISKGAATLGLLFFGWLFRRSTQRGKDLEQGLRQPFLVDAAVIFAGLLLASTLPSQLPSWQAVKQDGSEAVELSSSCSDDSLQRAGFERDGFPALPPL